MREGCACGLSSRGRSSGVLVSVPSVDRQIFYARGWCPSRGEAPATLALDARRIEQPPSKRIDVGSSPSESV